MTVLFKQKAEKNQILYLTPEIFWFWGAEEPKLSNSNSLAVVLNLGNSLTVPMQQWYVQKVKF